MDKEYMFHAAGKFFSEAPTGQYDDEAIQGCRYVSVRYLCVTGGSGTTRCYAAELPEWLAERPGTMIIGIDPD
jgi:hypothetical protein